jgi:hypothetical protein
VITIGRMKLVGSMARVGASPVAKLLGNIEPGQSGLCDGVFERRGVGERETLLLIYSSKRREACHLPSDERSAFD